MNRAIDAIPTEALRQLMSWDWPGNVRELENVIERAVLLTRGNSLNLHLNIRQSRLLPTLMKIQRFAVQWRSYCTRRRQRMTKKNVSALFRYCEKPMALLPDPVAQRRD